ncbi:DegT/DnrJ/EryC1/StrS family aminotransferase [Micromonospora sp. NPDC051300]|uniref:DegT/DnrJ/EryC1/StrS family aminotransferase n=1 Tax=Micromonospora sp. NPDC051300 TaxID=3364286 RepID=UPI0037B33C4C
MSKLAVLGGTRAVPEGTTVPRWPIVTDAERAAVLGVIDSGRFTVAAGGEQEIPALEREWADRVGVGHCVAVANGTIGLSIALAAAGVGPGDEVVVPALSFVGTALAVAHLGAVPVFVDIDPVSFNLDPDALRAALSDRTAAVVPVHLHGLPADMDEIGAVAARHRLAVVEDAAQAHGVAYRGRRTGSLGDLAAFSLNASKNLPTCGEGGLVTTDDARLAGRAALLRQFGERLPARGDRPYRSELAGWNGKINAIQAAFTRAQLAHLDEWALARDRNVRAFLDRTAAIPGLVAPTAPGDREHGWHILRFRLLPAAFDLPETAGGALRAAICRVLRGEGVPASRYQSMPLSRQPLFADGGPTCRRSDVPVTEAVVADSFVLQRVHLHPDAGPLLDRVADALEKVWEHRATLAVLARAQHGGDQVAA